MEISIEHLNKNYGKQNVLKDISLHIPIGMYGMLGENGAGKTTLMRILATLSEPTTGMVEINGIDIKRKKEIRKIIGYLPQEFSIYPNMTVYSALDYLGILTELPNNIRKRRINELLKQVNLEHEKNKRFKNLSGGMKRRFGIAQALLNDPKILIIDEPTAGLDPEERLRFYNLLSELAVERIILLSTHIASDIEATCSKAAVLSSGNITLNLDNLEYVCEDCHNKEHKAVHTPMRYQYDANGNLLPPKENNKSDHTPGVQNLTPGKRTEGVTSKKLRKVARI